MVELTQDELKKQLRYDYNTGKFRWLVANCNSIKIGDIAGYKAPNKYIYIRIDGKLYLAHRLTWLYIYGYFPESEIDHINRVRDDNRIINLREASHQCNMRNSNIQKNNTSGVVGIYWDKESNKWRSTIKVNKKQIHLGYFIDKIDAAKARWNAEVKYGFPNCNTISTAYQYLNKKGRIKWKNY